MAFIKTIDCFALDLKLPAKVIADADCKQNQHHLSWKIQAMSHLTRMRMALRCTFCPLLYYWVLL